MGFLVRCINQFMIDSRPLAACYLKLKRRTFWVVRWVEISPEGFLSYRNSKEDKQNKGEYNVLECKFTEMTVSDSRYLVMEPKTGETIKLLAHTEKDHKKLIGAIQQVRAAKEQQTPAMATPPKTEESTKQIVVISKNPIQQERLYFKPDTKLCKMPAGDQVKVQSQLFINEFETMVLTGVHDGVWYYRRQKEEIQPNIKDNQIRFLDKLIDLWRGQKAQLGTPMMVLIGLMFFILISVLIYLILELVDDVTYFYSILITLNIFLLPALVRANRSEIKVVSKQYVCGKTHIEGDYNTLTYLLQNMEIRKQWQPYLIGVKLDYNHQTYTATYIGHAEENFQQSIYIQEETFFIVEHRQSKILRVFQVRFINEEERVHLSYYSFVIQDKEHFNTINLVGCIKEFVNQQRQIPSSPLLEYQQLKSKEDNLSFVNDNLKSIPPTEEVQRRTVDQQRKPSHPPTQQSQLNPQQQQPLPPSNMQSIPNGDNPPESQIILSLQRPELNVPPEVQKYLDITNKARKYLEDFYNSPGWQQQSSASGFVVSTKTDEATGLTLSRGEGIIPYTYEQIYAIIEKVDRRGDYDPLFDSGYLFKQFQEWDLGIIYQKFKTIKIVVQSRDFVFVTRTFKEKDQWLMVAQSIEHPEIPPTAKSVRGECKIAGWILRQEPTGVRSCFINMVDPKGNVPSALVAFSAKEQGLTVERIKALLDKRSKK